MKSIEFVPSGKPHFLLKKGRLSGKPDYKTHSNGRTRNGLLVERR